MHLGRIWQVAAVTLLSGASEAAAIDRTSRPMYYLQGEGARAQETASLLWGLSAVSIAVVIVIGVLVLIGSWRSIRTGVYAFDGTLPALTRGGGGLHWIYAGLIVTTIVLAGLAVWTVRTMAMIGEPAKEPRFTVQVTGNQWWWRVRYEPQGDQSRIFVTANELHIPVGEPVRLRLTSADVIHSFWVPALTGKTDLIPGRVNEAWIQADKPGVYRGQCAEYCGQQHAHMALVVIADPPDQFQTWWDGQLKPAVARTGPVHEGERAFLIRCAVCHSVRGTPAGGAVGPDLTHVMSRTSIAAHTLPNNIGNLSAWIANPQNIKPGNKMPDLDISGTELAHIRTYLETLH